MTIRMSCRVAQKQDITEPSGANTDENASALVAGTSAEDTRLMHNMPRDDYESESEDI